MNTQNKLAYLAGYIDGDGSFILQITKRFRKRGETSISCTDYLCQISITGKHLGCLEFIQSNFGGSIYKHKNRIENQSQLFLYRKNVSKDSFLQDLLPFLTEKRDQCMTAIQFKSFSTFERKSLIEKIKEQRKQGYAYKGFKEECKSVKKTIHPTENDFAYLAGFIDSECCIVVNKKIIAGKYHSFAPIIRCGNSKFLPIKWMIERFGGVVFFIQKGTYGRSSPFCDYHLLGKDLAYVLERILPYLIHKREQAKECVKLIQLMKNRKGSRAKDFSDWQRSNFLSKESIYRHIQTLNQKGI